MLNSIIQYPTLTDKLYHGPRLLRNIGSSSRSQCHLRLPVQRNTITKHENSVHQKLIAIWKFSARLGLRNRQVDMCVIPAMSILFACECSVRRVIF